MNPADKMIPLLPWSKRTGPGRWIARCPAHEDKSPSLAITEKEDGRLLVFCHAGCEVSAIVGAVGLEISDLFPPRFTTDYKPPERRPVHAEDALKALAHEATVLAIYASEWNWGTPPNTDGIERIQLAAERCWAAVAMATGEAVATAEERRRIIAEARLSEEEEKALDYA
jgi:hypothetical protein